MVWIPLLADRDAVLEDLMAKGGRAAPNGGQFWLYWGALSLVVLLAVVWARFLRRRRPRRIHSALFNGRGRIHSRATLGASGGQAAPRRKRRRHRWRRNPTLAESGGLPSIRENRPPNRTA